MRQIVIEIKKNKPKSAPKHQPRRLVLAVKKQFRSQLTAKNVHVSLHLLDSLAQAVSLTNMSCPPAAHFIPCAISVNHIYFLARACHGSSESR